MAPPEQHLLKRRLQILDDETRDGRRFDGREDGGRSADVVMPARNLAARLAALVRKIGGKS